MFLVLLCRSKYSAYVDAKYSNPIDMMGSQVWEGVFGVVLVMLALKGGKFKP